uniref:S-adenosylmethionine decarboxylase proenzyme n=1 Tax=Elaeophora elaphi TaxID=1147741 RepID=A0A0R3RFD3_9BILA
MSTSTLSDGSLDEGTFAVEDMPGVMDDYFFEGAEKLLEMWFDKNQKGVTSLRNIPYSELVAMLDIAHCRILHSKSNECMDSYVLSESSMFVSDFRIILKTCGTTRLLHTIGRILHLAKIYCNMDNVISVFYSRKNFIHPERQPYPHSSFETEVDCLEEHFTGGSAYCIGPQRQDCWFLYTMVAPQATFPFPQHTLEILMNGLPEDVLSVFSSSVSKDGKDCRMVALLPNFSSNSVSDEICDLLTFFNLFNEINFLKKSAINTILPPGLIVHEELFNPCGYSLNGLIPHSDHYITIHVTPEPDFSYVSFETNQNALNLTEQMLKVLEIFRPNKFLLTIFTNELSNEGKEVQKNLWDLKIRGCRRTNLQFLELSVRFALRGVWKT